MLPWQVALSGTSMRTENLLFRLTAPGRLLSTRPTSSERRVTSRVAVMVVCSVPFRAVTETSASPRRVVSSTTTSQRQRPSLSETLSSFWTELSRYVIEPSQAVSFATSTSTRKLSPERTDGGRSRNAVTSVAGAAVAIPASKRAPTTAAVSRTTASATAIDNGTVHTCLTDIPRAVIADSGASAIGGSALSHTVERATLGPRRGDRGVFVTLVPTLLCQEKVEVRRRR